MSEIVYKGIRHTDVIAQNIERGGGIVEVHSSLDSHYETHKIVTDFGEGFLLVDVLVYTLNGLLQSWKVIQRGETYLLFDRAEYDQRGNEA